jgi:gliding motility-associated-like protein
MKIALLSLFILLGNIYQTQLLAQTATCFFVQRATETAATCTTLGAARIEVFDNSNPGSCPCSIFPTITVGLTNTATMALSTQVFTNVTQFPFYIDFPDLPAGTYRASVTTNDASCAYPSTTQTALEIEVPLNNTLTTSVLDIEPANCLSGSFGKVTVQAAGGLAPYTYYFDDGEYKNIPAGQNVVLDLWPPGMYTLTVEDAGGCTMDFPVEIPAHPNAAFNITETVKNISCSSSSDGSIALDVSGGGPGNPTYTYNWSNGGTTAAISGLAKGSYTVTVSSSAGCSTTQFFTIMGPPNGGSWGWGDYDACYNNDNGKIFFSADGGWGGWTYLWSNGETTGDIENLAPGAYTVTFTDQGGCIRTQDFTIGTSGGEPVSFATTEQRINSGETIEITMDRMASSAYEFIWAVSKEQYAKALPPTSGVWEINDGPLMQTLESANLRYPGQVEILVAPQYFDGCNGDTVRFTYEVLPFESGIFIPEIFTPNGDGQTDLWNIVLPPDFLDVQLTVYNRTGAKVYENDATIPWDGNNVADGTYFYLIQYTQTGFQKVLKGAVTVLRTN